jgi:cobalt-zinc-cadmium efflux system protein
VWHITGDLLGSLGAVGAATVMYFTGWTPIDPLLGIAIALLIGLAGGRILYDSAALLMDRVPSEIDTAAVRGFLAGQPDVRRICDLHIWGVSSSESLLTAHLVVEPSVDRDDLLSRLLPVLQERFGLAHLTVQLESRPHASCPEEW